MRADRIVRRIRRMNPDVTITRGHGSSHWKIYHRARLVGILPSCFAREGMAENTKSALRREGISF